jgi:SAM-dependent methyltransferase
VSALVYRHTYDSAAHRVDERTIAAVKDVVLAGVVVDAGCGPGVVVPRFVQAGARKVLAVDVSASMLKKVPALSGVKTIAADLQPGAFQELRAEYEPGGFDLIWFKRSLYHEDRVAVELLRDAYASLRPGGRIVVIHPESSLRRYLFDVQRGRTRLAPYTAYHTFNRFISVFLSSLRLHTYRHRTAQELLLLGSAVDPSASAHLLETGISAFNTLLIERGDSA